MTSTHHCGMNTPIHTYMKAYTHTYITSTNKNISLKFDIEEELRY